MKWLAAVFVLLMATGMAGAVDNVTTLVLTETQLINRSEYVHNGFPLSTSDNIISTSSLGIRDENYNRIDADFEVLSRWGGGYDEVIKPIQWLLLTFPVTIDADQTKNYTLTKNEVARQQYNLTVTENSTMIIVNTTSAVFYFDKNESFMDRATYKNSSGQYNDVITPGSVSSINVHGNDSGDALSPTEMSIDKNNSLFATIKVSGIYNTSSYGTESKPMCYTTRFSFYADSSSVVINHYYGWHGAWCNHGGVYCQACTTLVVTNVAFNISTDINNGVTGYALVNDTIYNESVMGAGEETSLSQLSRADIRHGANYSLCVAGAYTNGTYATTPAMGMTDPKVGIIATIDKMYYKEPCGMVINGMGDLNINLVEGNTRMGQYQGNMITFTLSLRGNDTNETVMRENVFAPSHHRILACPTRNQLVTSGVFGELYLNSGSSPHQNIIDRYTSVTSEITNNTLESIENASTYLIDNSVWTYSYFPTHGTMTYGYHPRYIGNTGGDAITIDTNTSMRWDDYYMAGTFTDYHNAFQNVVLQGYFDQNPDVFHLLATPGAQRLVYTQVIQCDNSSSSGMCGWGYSGYGQYRTDANSGHSYFENLISYYYLTGDRGVLETLDIGTEKFYSMKVGVARTESQAQRGLLFLGKTYNTTYLTALEGLINDSIDEHILYLTNGSKQYTLLSSAKIDDVGKSATTAQEWMNMLYFMDFMRKYSDEFDKTTFGTEAIPIENIFEGYANTLYDYSRNLAPLSPGQYCSCGSDGTAAGDWSKQFVVTWTSGAQNGTMQSIAHDTSSNEECLYSDGKAKVGGILLHVGNSINNKTYYDMGVDLVNETVQTSVTTPWAKTNGILYLRMHHAISFLEPGYSPTGFSVDYYKTYFNTTSTIENVVNGSGYHVWDRTITASDTESTFVIKVTT